MATFLKRFAPPLALMAFVPGREGTPWDVAIDAAGVGVAGALVVAAARRGRWRPGPAATADRSG